MLLYYNYGNYLSRNKHVVLEIKMCCQKINSNNSYNRVIKWHKLLTVMVHHALLKSRHNRVVSDITEIITLLFALCLLWHYYFNYFLLFSMIFCWTRIIKFSIIFSLSIITLILINTYYVNYIYYDHYDVYLHCIL